MIQLTSMHWGTYRYETENGKVTALKPFEDDTTPTTIGQGILDVLDHETRITQPMVRQSWLEGGPAIGRRKNEGLIGLSPLTGTPPASWLVKNCNGSLTRMAIRLFLPGPMAGPVLADFIMHKSNS